VIKSRVGVAAESEVDKAAAKSKVPAENPPAELHWEEVIASIVVLVIPLVSIFPKVEEAQADPLQYFQVVLPSNETKYLILVLVGRV